MRYFLELAYKGTAYHGWQIQPNAVTVQGTLTVAMEQILQRPIALTGSSRTDTGVHAAQQYAHFDIAQPLHCPKLVYQLNAVLPADISVQRIIPMRGTRAEAHARYQAMARSYAYRLTQRKNPFLNDTALYYPSVLDFEVMNQAAAYLLGSQDCRSFSKSKTNLTHFRCTIHQAEWQEEGAVYYFRIRANRFVRGMVRAIVGTLLKVGQKQWAPADVQKIIHAKDRQVAGPAAAAKGLTLQSVHYPIGWLTQPS